jgi:hypothetical protein
MYGTISGQILAPLHQLRHKYDVLIQGSSLRSDSENLNRLFRALFGQYYTDSVIVQPI